MTGLRRIGWMVESCLLVCVLLRSIASAMADEASQPKNWPVPLSHVTWMAWSPDGKLIAIGGIDKLGTQGDGVILLFGAEGGEVSTKIVEDQDKNFFYGGQDKIRQFAFSPDSKTLAVAAHGGVRLYDTTTGRPTATLFGYGKPPPDKQPLPEAHSVAYSPDGKNLAVSRMIQMEIWDADKEILKTALDMNPRTFGGLAFSSDGSVLASAEYLNRVHLWDPVSGNQLSEIHPQMGVLRNVGFSPDGKMIVVNGEGAAVISVRGAAPKLELADVRRLRGHFGPVVTAAFSPDRRFLLTVGGTAKLWDTMSWEQITTIDRGTRCAAFSPDGKQLALGMMTEHGPTPTASIHVWNVADAVNPATIKAQSEAAAHDLVQAIKTNDTERARYIALEALVGKQSAMAEKVLRDLEKNDPDPAVQKSAGEMLQVLKVLQFAPAQ